MTPKNSDLVLITGASNGLGSAIFESLTLRGISCAKAGREEERYFSLGVPPTLGILNNVKTIIHFAYDYSCSSYEKSYEVNVVGSRQLLELAENSQVNHIILVSSDSAQENAKSIYGRTKFETENIFRISTKTSIIRIGLIGGSIPSGPFGRMVSIARKFKIGIIPTPDCANFTYIRYEDLVTVFEALTRGEPCGGPFSASREEALTSLSSALSKEMTGRYFRLKLPSASLYRTLKAKESILGFGGIRSDSIKSFNTPVTNAKVQSIWKVLRLQD